MSYEEGLEGKNLVSEMKLAVIVSLFDGEELLKGALSQIRNHVDTVIVIWQKVSNWGEKYPEVTKTVNALKREGLIDFAQQYRPNFMHSPRENELEKRKIGLQMARSQNCTHFVFIDSDEYYDAVQFENAKDKIEKERYDSSFCRLYGYYREPIYRLEPIEGIFVPFIHKLTSHTVLWKKKHHRSHDAQKIPVDPTRATYPIGKSIIFDTEDIVMHHYTLVRKDMGRKLRNSSAKLEYGMSVEELLALYEKFDSSKLYDNIILKEGHHLIVVPNSFGISL